MSNDLMAECAAVPAARHGHAKEPRHASLSTAVVVLILALLLVRSVAASDDRWAFSPALAAEELTALVGRDGCYLDQWVDADLRYDHEQDGIVGEITYGSDVWLRDTDALRRHARIQRYQGPTVQLSATEIIALPTRGGKPRRIDSGNLAWQGMSAGDGSTVTLDATIDTAVLPGLRVGDRLRITKRYRWYGRHGMPVITICQDSEPCSRVAVRIRVPREQELTFQFVGPDSMASAVRTSTIEDGPATISTWDFRDPIPAGRAGNARRHDDLRLVTHLMSDGRRLRPGAFVASTSWANAASRYDARISPYLDVTPALEELAHAIIEGHASIPARIAALHDHVQRSTRYLGIYSGDGTIIPNPADQTRELGYGDCKGLAAYLVALCRAVGIGAHPVLVLIDSDERLASGVPNLGQFNHMIAWADDGQAGCWLDPTLDGVPAGVLTARHAASPVLPICQDAPGLIEIPATAWAPGVRRFSVTGALSDGLRLRVAVTCTAAGPGATVLRSTLDRMSADDRERAVHALLLSPALRLEQSALLSPLTDDGPASWQLGVNCRRPLTATDRRAFLSAEIPVLNPLHWEAGFRRSGIDLRGVPAHEESWRIALPDGWMVQDVEPIDVTAPGFFWRRSVRQVGRELVLSREIGWPEHLLVGQAAQDFRELLDAAVARERAPLVLIKEVVR